MSRLLASLALAIIACGSGDDTVEGARGECATGGALNDCPPAEQTPDGACWRLVDCAAIPLRADMNNVFDWGSCVNYVESLTDDRERLIISCIAASACDALKVQGSPDKPQINDQQCFILTEEP
jgi:hypothetical protein